MPAPLPEEAVNNILKALFIKKQVDMTSSGKIRE